MTQILYFRAKGNQYTFPIYQEALTTNFTQVLQRMQRAVGMDGGVDQEQDRPYRKEIGSISLDFNLRAYLRDGMDDLRRDVKRMERWGRGTLWMKPAHATRPARFCVCKVANIGMNEQLHKHTDLIQPVRINFSAEDPRWYSRSGWEWGDGTLWGENNWAAPQLSTTGGDGDTWTLTNNGDTDTPIHLTLTATGTSSNIRIARIENGREVDGFFWRSSLAAGDKLIINGWDLSITQFTSTGLVSAYHLTDVIAGTGYLRLEPGANTLQLNGTLAAPAAIRVGFYDAWS
jgi:hypothetical protein